MDYPSGGEGPSVLQLHKWPLSGIQLNLSEFREAFISPTKQILLLLSYECESLLLPLAGGSKNNNTLEDLGGQCVQNAPDSRSGSMENIPCTSGSSMSFVDDISPESSIPSSVEYPLICDVYSLAWGVSGDTYNYHKDASFGDLLFVSTCHGVTVHAFCQPAKSNEFAEDVEGQFEQGRWVEWGPSNASEQNFEVQEPSGSSYKATESSFDVNGVNGINEHSHKTCREAGNDGLSRSVISKRWLRSFSTEAETVTSDGDIWTKFPEKSSFPCSARVVSFSIFGSNLSSTRFLSHSTSLPKKGSLADTELDPVDDFSVTSKADPPSFKFKSEVLSKFLGVGVDSLWKCFRVFSSTSHHIVGFVLTSLDPISSSDSDVSQKCRSKNLIVISRLDSWGMHWVSSVKLDGSANNSQVPEWVDFRFSDDLLVCLNASGLIYFYAVTTGEYVTHLDIVNTCRVDPQPSMVEQDKMSMGVDIQIKQVDKILDESTNLHGDLCKKYKFRKLVLAAYTSLLGVVDENGLIYLICVGDYIPTNYSSSKKLLPRFQHLGLGILVGWEVGGSEIGRQRVYSESGSYNSSISSITNGCFCFLDNVGSTKLHEAAEQNPHGKQSRCDSCMSGFSAGSKIIDERFHDYKSSSHFTRKIFLPIDKFSVDDCICISPLGITQLIKKGSVKDHLSSQIVHFDLHGDLAIHDDRCFNSGYEMLKGREKTFFGEAVGCTFQGCFYLVTQDGLSVVLPSISGSKNFLPMESIGYQQPSANEGTADKVGDVWEMNELRLSQSPWILELLDKTILYEGPEVADHLCLKNGWDLKISRMRRLQIALDYLKYQEIEQSLEMLVDVNMAEDGILRLLFAAVDVMFHKVGNDNEVAAALRLLVLATRFATKVIRSYGLIQYKKDAYVIHGFKRTRILPLPPILPNEVQNEIGNSRRLREMSRFLEIIRNLQRQLNGKLKRPGQGMVDDGIPDTTSHDESQLSVLSANHVSLETPSQNPLPFSVRSTASNNTETLALMPMVSKSHLNLEVTCELSSALVLQDGVSGKRALPVENPKEMIARWKLDNLDLKTIVKDALLSGRLPLAVLQLHLHRSRDFLPDKDPQDTFTEVRDIGRAIAYDLFLKGETELAVATLQRLGEDIEINLKQLLFGTVRRSLRVQIMKEMKKYGYLGPFEWKILETMSLIERLYPSTSFWRTFRCRQKELMGVTSDPHATGQPSLQVLHSGLYSNLIIECGEIDGVVLGSWTSSNESSSVPSADEESPDVGYWTAAAVWSNSWDQRTIDRIVLDQPFHMGVHVPWESQLVYHVCHNDWQEVSKILDLIPTSVLSHGNLQINLDHSQPTSNAVGYNRGSSEYDSYICSIEELDAVCMDIPDIRIFRFPANVICSMWLKRLMEQELAKKYIFLKDYWESTAEIVPLLACSGLMTKRYEVPLEDVTDESSSDMGSSYADGTFRVHTVQALHKLFVHHCAQYNLPNLLDIYLDHHNLVVDNDSLSSLLEAAGDCQWARWLLLSRIKGREYDASFANARSIMSCNVVPDSNLGVMEADEIIHTVDDIAEGGGELAALATLMYSPVPIQNCLSTGSVNWQSNSSAQCTLENLRPTLQRYPTLWRTLVAACFGQDTTCNFSSQKANIVNGHSALVDYLDWRDDIFFSTGRDTSLLQMLPCWFPKSVRRLVQLYVQGPLGWQSLSGLPTSESYLHRDFSVFINSDEHAEISEMSWEATIQKHVEEELYYSALEETGLGLDHYLHRGRPLAAFNHLLAARVELLKSGQSGVPVPGQTNVQADVQTLLAPITLNEESLISSVMPLAIMHFEDSVLVASCAFLLELCGLSVSMLRIDILALRRISSFYKTSENTENYKQLSRNGFALHTVSREHGITESLARALADEYLHQKSATITKEKETSNSTTHKKPLRALMLVLQHLEKASLPQIVDGTCGSWLLNGNGDGTELRSQQKAASQHWNLVTVFCQMHQLPLSTKYLAALAKDNDWVGFLSEAQVGGYPSDKVVEVASKEFSDARLKVHILTVLKGLQSRKKASSSSFLDTIDKDSEASSYDENKYITIELFAILADCEKQKSPGEALLVKAKDLSWSLLAMIASCFPDVSPLSCLTVWLEITAARETSSVKVNDIASQIATNVGAAVEATNSLPAGSRALTFHYNRRNAKRRHLLEPISVDPLTARTSDVSNTSASGRVEVGLSMNVEDERKIEIGTPISISNDSDEDSLSLSKMVAVLCEQHLFLPLLRAFDMFLPSCSLLPFIRALQAFSQMRLSEASAHLGSFSARIKEEPFNVASNTGREGQIGTSWISATAVTAADAMLSTCPSPYERRCLLQLLAATDFGDGGSAAAYYRRCYWKINLAEPLLRRDDLLHLGNETLDDASLLEALENSGHWEQARTWAKQLEASGGSWKSAVHHVTETQAESMVAEWKEFLWDVPEERVALWSHCQTLFIRYSFPPLQAGLFFLKHAEAVEKDIPARELHELLLLSVQWLSGMITMSNPVYPLHILREIETRVWLLAVESEAQMKSEGDFTLTSSARDHGIGNRSNIIDRTASIITKMDSHMNTMKNKTLERQDARENNQMHQKNQGLDTTTSTSTGGTQKPKRRAKGYAPSRRPLVEPVDKVTDHEDGSVSNVRNELQLSDENIKLEMSFSRWEERVEPAELERAVLSLLEFGQVTAAKQLQHKLSPGHVPSEFTLVDAALKLAVASTPQSEVPVSMLDEEVRSVIELHKIPIDQHLIDPLQVLENLATIFAEGCGQGLCKKIIAVVKAANVLGLSFSEAFDKQPIEVLQLLSLKAQESFDEAKLMVQTHSMPAASVAQILAESFLKGLLAAHRGGYMDSQKEEGPAPLLWRFSDFLKWAELCPSEPEIGHALMRLVITGQEIPHACEVELLILSHHFYKSSACLDGVDVLVALAATRVEAYVSEGDFPCLARLITGVGNFHALNFILGILIENGQLDLLLQKYSAAADTNTGTAEAVRGFRMAVLTSLKHFNPNDLDAFAMVYNHFDMKHETAALLESRAQQSSQLWFHRYDKDQNEDLLDSMRYFIEAAEVHTSIDAGNKTHRACARASLVSLQIRMPDFQWLNLSETNARRALVEQSRFQEALIVAEAYGLNQPSEWALVLWNQMLKPELTEEFVAEFVAVLPLQPSMLIDLARFYRAEVAARGDQSQFSVWLTGGGLPAEWAKYLERSFRCLLKRTRDLRLRSQLASVATGFLDVIDGCMKALDKVPDNAGPLVLRKGHGGAYLPLM